MDGDARDSFIPLAFCLLLACLHPWVKNLSKVAWARHQGSKNENTMGSIMFWTLAKLLLFETHGSWYRTVSPLLQIFWTVTYPTYPNWANGTHYWLELVKKHWFWNLYKVNFDPHLIRSSYIHLNRVCGFHLHSNGIGLWFHKDVFYDLHLTFSLIETGHAQIPNQCCSLVFSFDWTPQPQISRQMSLGTYL